MHAHQKKFHERSGLSGRWHVMDSVRRTGFCLEHQIAHFSTPSAEQHRGLMFQGGDHGLQPRCGPFDSGRFQGKWWSSGPAGRQRGSPAGGEKHRLTFIPCRVGFDSPKLHFFHSTQHTGVVHLVVLLRLGRRLGRFDPCTPAQHTAPASGLAARLIRGSQKFNSSLE